MKELNKEELLKWLEEIENIWSKWSKEIYQQIRQLIESQPICIFCSLPIIGKEGACGECANRALEDLTLLPKRRKV